MSEHEESRRWLIVPIETKVRELDAKALFACEAAERGWGTLLGKVEAGDRDRLPRGLFVLKGIPPGCGRSLRMLRRMGHKIASWCEEGLIYRAADEYAFRKLETASFPLLDLFFAWGAHHARDLVEGLGCDARTLVVTGNPRFDLLRPELRAIFAERAACLEREHGRFILINTKLNRYNNYFGTDWYVNRMRTLGEGRGDAFDAAVIEDEAVRCVEFQRRTYMAFIEAAIALSRRFPETRIVLRPHPSEDHEPWKQLAGGLRNVRVVFEGNVIPWLLASAVTIQNNCTTGVESFLLGRPTIAYRPIVDPSFDMVLPNAVSVGAFNLESLLDLTDRALRAEALPLDGIEAARETIRDYVTGLDGASACAAILDAIDACDVPPGPPPAAAAPPANGDPNEWDAAPSDPPPGTERFYGRAGAERYHGYRRQKCDALPVDEVRGLVDTLRRTTGRFGGVRVDAVTRDLVCIRGQ